MNEPWEQIYDPLSDQLPTVPWLALSAGIAFASLATRLGTIALNELIRMVRLGVRWEQ
jgi:hypothetical protein